MNINHKKDPLRIISTRVRVKSTDGEITKEPSKWHEPRFWYQMRNETACTFTLLYQYNSKKYNKLSGEMKLFAVLARDIELFNPEITMRPSKQNGQRFWLSYGKWNYGNSFFWKLKLLQFCIIRWKMKLLTLFPKIVSLSYREMIIIICNFYVLYFNKITIQKILTQAGLEPTISCSVGRRLIHWATEPWWPGRTRILYCHHF